MKTRYQELVEELGRIMADDFKKDIEDHLIEKDQDIGAWLIESTQINEDITDAIVNSIKGETE